jgi:hypothetical protein
VQHVTQTFQISVLTTVTITTSSLPDGIQGAAYNQQLQALGTAPFIWGVTSGSLPAGLSLTAAGILQGTPTVVGSQTFGVTVTDARGGSNTQSLSLTVDPPLPTLSLSGVPATLNPTQNSPVSLSLSSSFPNALSGKLVLSFTSTADIPADDQATQFSTGTRTVAFTIPANSTNAVFSAPVMLLVGTVAGTVNLTANFDNGPTGVSVGSVAISAMPPQVTSVTATRTIGGINVQIIGYAPSRRMTNVGFSFNVKNGNKTQAVTIADNVGADFAAWYQSPASTQFGSSFSFVQFFTTTGDASLIEDVTVSLTNAQGSTSYPAVPLH